MPFLANFKFNAFIKNKNMRKKEKEEKNFTTSMK